MLSSILNSDLTISSVLVCSGISLILGIIIALVHKWTSTYSKNFLITLAVLPILVQTIIFMTSGNLGTSFAVAGAFSLIRFRTLPGTSKEIMSVFYAMAIGLAMGMGQIAFAAIITVLVGTFIIILSKSKFGENNNNGKILKVTLPEDMDYETVFDDVFNRYLDSYKLESVKTVNMGSLFELTYTVNSKKNISEKKFIDEIRIKNGNLKVSLSHAISNGGEL